MSVREENKRQQNARAKATKHNSETNKEREDRRQVAKLAIACNDTLKLHFVLSLVFNPFSNAMRVNARNGHPDSYSISNGMQHMGYVLYRDLVQPNYAMQIFQDFSKQQRHMYYSVNH